MKDTHKMRGRLTLVIGMTLVFVAGLLASRYVYETPVAQQGAAGVTQVATVLEPPRALPDFELIDQASQPLAKNDLAGRWTLVFMGFTNCGHICPNTLFTLSKAVKKLPAPPKVLFISVDPGRDSPAIIDTYVEAFGEAFNGATGAESQLQKLAEGLNAPFRVSTDDGRYIVDHSNAVFLLDPATRFRALFSAPHNADVIADDLEQIMEMTETASAAFRKRY
jgi:protein SCO1/2